jgi:hypothetical protein
MGQYTLIVAETEWRKGYRLVNLLLRAGVPVFWLLDEATSASGADEQAVILPRGSFLLGEERHQDDRHRTRSLPIWLAGQACTFKSTGG